MMTLSEIIDSPCFRREARAAGGDRLRVLACAIAGSLNLGALGALIWALFFGSYAPPEFARLMMDLLAAGMGAALLVAVLPAVWFLAPALAGEKETDSLKALLLTPLPRRTIVWAKLLGRTQPLRRFLLALLPFFIVAPVAFVLWSTHGLSCRLWGTRLTAPFGMACLVTAAVVTGLLAWLMAFFVAHMLGAITLYYSARSKGIWSTMLKAELVGVAVPLCLFLVFKFVCLCWAIAFLYYFLLAPRFFRKLILNFDRYVAE